MKQPFSHLASTFVLAQLRQLVEFVTVEKDFFSLSSKERVVKLEASNLLWKKYLANYLRSINSDQFVADCKALVRDCESYELRERTELTQKVIEHLLQDFVPILKRFSLVFDTISQHCWALSNSEKIPFINDIQGLADYEKEWLLRYSYQELCNGMYDIIKLFAPEMPFLIIQSARECTPNLKSIIRKHYKNAFPIFMVSVNLMGGMRVLVDGQLVDDSWLNKIVFLQEKATLKM